MMETLYISSSLNTSPFVKRSNLVLFVWFLKRDINKAFAEVKSKPINRGAGFGLEISCVYYLYGVYGPKIYIDKMKEIVDALSSDGLL